MLTQKDKESYEKYSKNKKVNVLFYSLAKNIYVKPLRYLTMNLHIEGRGNLDKIILEGGQCIAVPYHTICIEEPLLGEYLHGKITKPHALMDVDAFERHRNIYSILEEIPFNTSCKVSFKEDYKWSFNEMKNWLARGDSLLIYGDGPTQAHLKICKDKNIQGVLPLSERPNTSIPAELSFETQIPILPIASRTTKDIENELYVWKNWKCWFKVLGNMRIPYTLEFLEPMYPRDFKNPCEMKRELRKRQNEAREKN